MKRTIVTALALAAVASASLRRHRPGRLLHRAAVHLAERQHPLHAQPQEGPRRGHRDHHRHHQRLLGPERRPAGSGTFFAQLSSPAASKTTNNETGTFVINWPAASGLNPTTGRISTTGPNAGLYVVNGADNGGAYASGVLSTGWAVTGQTLGGKKHNQVLGETFVNTLPLAIKVNSG